MSKAVKEKKGKTVPVWMGVLAFLLAFGAGVASKTAVKPAWSKAYSVQWSSELGTLKADLPYGEGEANKFDLYVPADRGRESYGLVVYLHAGGFTSGAWSDIVSKSCNRANCAFAASGQCRCVKHALFSMRSSPRPQMLPSAPAVRRSVETKLLILSNLFDYNNL